MEKVINQVKNNWSKDLVIRFLYIKLAPYFQRDCQYFLASSEEKKRQYKQGFINRFPHVVCSTLADFYVDLFNQFGINAKKVIATSAQIPLFAIIVEGDYGWYFLDPINDLFSNQYGLKPYFFGIIPRYKTINNNHPEMIKLSSKYVEELDTALGINYFDDLFSDLHSIFVNRKNANEFFGIPRGVSIDLRERKLQFYSNKLINLGNVNGPLERAKLYQYLNDKSFNRSEKHFTRVRLISKLNDFHVSIELINYEKSTLYEEEKQGKKYVLTKKL